MDFPQQGHFQQSMTATFFGSVEMVITPLWSPIKSGEPVNPFWRAIPSFMGVLHFRQIGFFMAVTVTRFSAPVELLAKPDNKAGTKDGKENR